MEFYHNSGYYFHFRPIVPTRFCIDHVWKLRLVRPSSYCVSDFNNYLRSSLKRRLLCPCHISNSFFFLKRKHWSVDPHQTPFAEIDGGLRHSSDSIIPIILLFNHCLPVLAPSYCLPCYDGGLRSGPLFLFLHSSVIWG